MAKLSISIPDDFQKQLDALPDFERVAKKMVNAATPILQNSVKSTLSRKIRNSERNTGDLVKSVKRDSAKKNKKGIITGRIYFAGYTTHHYKNKKQKVANATKAMSKEYGTSKQTATPFMNESVKKCESQVLDVMNAVYESEVQK